MPAKKAIEQMDEVVKHPTLDDYMRRVPPLTEQEYKDLIVSLREERPLYIAKEKARKEAKE